MFKSGVVYISVGIVIIACCFLFLKTPTSYNTPTKKKIYPIYIGGSYFEIPSKYALLVFPPPKDWPADSVGNGVNLDYVLPDYTSLGSFKTKSEYDSAFKKGDFAHMLVKGADKAPPIGKMIQVWKKRAKKIEKGGVYQGFEKETIYELKDGKILPERDIYIEYDEKRKVISYIDCTRLEWVPFPGCSDHFLDKNLIINSTYRIKYLPKWRELRESTIKFVRSFEVPAVNIEAKTP